MSTSVRCHSNDLRQGQWGQDRLPICPAAGQYHPRFLHHRLENQHLIKTRNDPRFRESLMAILNDDIGSTERNHKSWDLGKQGSAVSADGHRNAGFILLDTVDARTCMCANAHVYGRISVLVYFLRAHGYACMYSREFNLAKLPRPALIFHPLKCVCESHTHINQHRCP